MRTQEPGSRGNAEVSLAAQYLVARVLAEAKTLDEATPGILEAIGGSIGWQVAGLWTANRSRTELRFVDSWHRAGFETPTFDRACRETPMPAGVGLPGRVLENAMPLWIPDVTIDKNFPRAKAALADGLHAAAAFPIRLARDVFGVIESFSTEVLEPDEELLELLAVVGNHISHFILSREAEISLRDTEAIKAAIVQNAIDCVISIDHQGLVIEWNPAAEETFGYSRPDVIGKEMAELIIPPRLRERHRQGIKRYLETGEGPLLNKRVEITGMRADGAEIPLELAIIPVKMEGAPIFTGYLRDITESKRAEGEKAELLLRERTAREEAESAGKRLWQLQHITEAALSHLSLEELFDELLMRIAEVLNIEVAAILLSSDDGGYLTVRGPWACPLEARAEGSGSAAAWLGELPPQDDRSSSRILAGSSSRYPSYEPDGPTRSGRFRSWSSAK